LECLAEFHGAWLLETLESKSDAPSPYRFMADFFDPNLSERWSNPSDRAHKTFIVLAYLDSLDHPAYIS